MPLGYSKVKVCMCVCVCGGGGGGGEWHAMLERLWSGETPLLLYSSAGLKTSIVQILGATKMAIKNQHHHGNIIIVYCSLCHTFTKELYKLCGGGVGPVCAS